MKIRKAIRLTIFIKLCTAVFPVFAEDQDIAKILQQYDAEGTVVIASLDRKTTNIYNEERANIRLSPASTFKIPNSIIAIEEKVLADQNQIIVWDGKKWWLPAWNKDQNLKTAFQSSCVWFYQALAKKYQQKPTKNICIKWPMVIN